MSLCAIFERNEAWNARPVSLATRRKQSERILPSSLRIDISEAGSPRKLGGTSRGIRVGGLVLLDDDEL